MRGLLAFAIIFATIASAQAAPLWTEQNVSIDGGSAPLYGTLTLPSGTGPLDVALILPGSGPTDRNGNFPGRTNNSLLLLAHGLADAGIASLRIDKRGVAASALAYPPERDLRFTTYVDDATQWLTFLKNQPRVGRIFLIGHSEGALVATLAARTLPVSGLVLIAGAGRPAPSIIREQLAALNYSASLQERAEAILQKLEAGETVPDVPAELAALYRPSAQPYLISWLKYDPANELAKLTTPTLIIQGTNDLQITIADAQRLASARKNIALLTIKDMNHVLKIAPADRAGNIRLYSDPDAPLANGLVAGIVDFIHAK